MSNKLTPVKHKRSAQIGGVIVNAEPGETHNLTFDLDKGEYTLVNEKSGYREEGSTTLEIGYDGEHRRKSLTAIPYSYRDSSDVKKAFTEFDLIFSIDTNLKQIGSIFFEVGSVHLLKDVREESGKVFLDIELVQIFYNLHSREDNDLEKKNWINCIDYIRKKWPDAKKVMIITDHDKNNHNHYNDRKKKICDQYLIPEGFVLCYARDKGELWMNKLLKISDSYNTKVIKEITKKSQQTDRNMNRLKGW